MFITIFEEFVWRAVSSIRFAVAFYEVAISLMFMLVMVKKLHSEVNGRHKNYWIICYVIFDCDSLRHRKILELSLQIMKKWQLFFAKKKQKGHDAQASTMFLILSLVNLRILSVAPTLESTNLHANRWN